MGWACKNRRETRASDIQQLCVQWNGIRSTALVRSFAETMREGREPHGQKHIRSWRFSKSYLPNLNNFSTIMYMIITCEAYTIAVIPSPEARKNLMKLAQRMIKTFGLNMSTSGGQSWTAISDSPEDTVRITTRKVTEPGQPNGVILSAVSTTWLPYSHTKVFDLLRDERHRSQVVQTLQFNFNS